MKFNWFGDLLKAPHSWHSKPTRLAGYCHHFDLIFSVTICSLSIPNFRCAFLYVFVYTPSFSSWLVVFHTLSQHMLLFCFYLNSHNFSQFAFLLNFVTMQNTRTHAHITAYQHTNTLHTYFFHTLCGRYFFSSNNNNKNFFFTFAQTNIS